MARSNWNLLRSLLARAERVSHGEADDADLLRRFAESKDAAAFELLVRRHADLVQGVCRRVCRDEHDAEDAFQASFLVLARKAGRVHTNLAGWLHRTAHRAALRAAGRRSRIQTQETALSVEPVAPTAADIAELRPLLDAEIDRLPDRLRLAVLHCYVEGRTTEDAADRLGVPRGTVLSRLSKARDVLGKRLARKGVTAPVTAISLSAALAGEAASASLVGAATSSVLLPVAGSAAQLISLEVLKMTAWKTPAALAAAIMLTAGLGTGTAVLLAQGGKPAAVAESPQPPPAQAQSGVLRIGVLDPQPADPAAAAKQRSAKINELERRIEENQAVQSRLALTLRDQRTRERNQRISQIDPALLMSTINRIDAECLSIQDQADELAAQTSAVQARCAEEIERAKTRPFGEIEMKSALLEYPEVAANEAQLTVARKALSDAKAAAAKGAHEKAQADLQRLEQLRKALFDKHRPIIEDRNRAIWIENAKRPLKQHEASVIALMKKLQIKQDRRKALQEQLKAAPVDDGTIRHLERAIERTDRVNEELSRKLIFLKADMDEDPSKSAMERLHREIAELRAEVRKLAEKK